MGVWVWVRLCVCVCVCDGVCVRVRVCKIEWFTHLLPCVLEAAHGGAAVEEVKELAPVDLVEAHVEGPAPAHEARVG